MKHTTIALSILLASLATVAHPRTANTPQAQLHLGRIWVNPEYDGAEGWDGSVLQYPGGIPRTNTGIVGDGQPNTPHPLLKRGWVGHGQKAGTYLLAKDWTDPEGTVWEYVSSYFYRSMDYNYPPVYRPPNEAGAFNYLYPVGIQEKLRWSRPRISVDGVEITFFPGPGEVMFPDNSGAGSRPDPIIDPTLVTEEAIETVWRYIPGVELRRTQYAYPYGSSHQDYVLMDITLTNNGISGRTDDAPVLTGQTVHDVIWAQAFNYRNVALRNNAQRDKDNDGMYVEPWGPGNHSAALFWDGDDEISGETPGPDWGDPAEDRYYENHLLANAHVLIGPVFASAGPGAQYSVDDPVQPALRVIWYERGLDFAGRPYSPWTPQEQRAMLTDPELEMPLGVSYRENPATEAIAQENGGATAILGYGPVTPIMCFTTPCPQPLGWTLGWQESVRVVQVMAAGGIDQEQGRRIGAIWNERRLGGAPPSTWMSPDDIALVQSGRDTALKAAAFAYWNFHGTMPANVTTATLRSWGTEGPVAKSGVFNQPFNVPDAPRPPAEFSVRSLTADEGGGIEVRWSREPESEPDHDTGIQDFVGYRLWRQEGSRLAPWELLTEGHPSAFHEGQMIGGSGELVYYDRDVQTDTPYWYAVTAYDDGSQNWAEPGASLESSRWWTWTGYDPNGVLALAAPPPPPPGPDGTPVSGTITTTTWTKAGSPYRVVGEITVPAGNTLTIEPGVDVLFDADVQFVVQGSLRAVGTARDSIRFTRGAASAWVGIRISGADTSTIAFARVLGARADIARTDGHGGGVSVSGPSARLEIARSLFAGNYAGMSGGGLCVSDGGHAAVLDCDFVDNVAVGAGGGVAVRGTGRAQLSGCTVRRNRALDSFPYGGTGGVLIIGSTVDMERCVVSENEAPYVSGGVEVSYGANAKITGCTITRNVVTRGYGGVYGGGLTVREGSQAVVRNCIAWGNVPDDVQVDGDATAAIAYCDISNYSVGRPPVIPAGTPFVPKGGSGNINADPLFVDAAAGDYHLQAGSPCIDAGDPTSQDDPDGTRADMGAFPFDQGGGPGPGTPLSGTITTTTWTKAKSPYRVVGQVTVPAGNTLTIEPGVDVLFDANVQFIVRGSLQAVGTEADSIRFVNGQAAEWRGIRLIGGGSHVIAHARISDAHAAGPLPTPNPGIVPDEERYSTGGGLFATDSAHVRLYHVVFRGNRADHVAGAFAAWYGAVATIEGCLFTGNSSVSGGGALEIDRSKATLRRCVIADNEVTGREPYGTSGGVLLHYGASTLFENCTITGNRAGSVGGAVGVSYGSSATFVNTIVWNNAPDQLWSTSDSKIEATYCDIANPLAYSPIVAEYSPMPAPWPGEGNIAADPLFRDAARGEYGLRPGSPCIDAGSPNSPKDPDGTRADMGAFPSDHGANGPRLVLPKLVAKPDSVVIVPVRGTFSDADGVDLAFVIDRHVLVPQTPFVLKTAFDGVPDAQVFSNIVGDTVFVTMASSRNLSVSDEMVAVICFRVNAETPLGTRVPLTWVPYPVTNVSETDVPLVDGEVLVQKRLYGDVSGDGTLSSYDASLVLQYIVRLLSAIERDIADVSANGTISSHDAAYIMKKVLDPSLSFPVSGEEGLTRATASAHRTLSWQGDGTAWRLVIDDPAGVESGQMNLLVDEGIGAVVAGGDLLSVNREGSVVRVAFVDLNPIDGVLLRLETSMPLGEPPRVSDIMLNEGQIDVGTTLVPAQFVLEQNAPNPFNPRTLIRFAIPASGSVTLTVYDVSGRIIRTLAHGPFEPGSHDMVWDGTDALGRPMASGVYLYRLSVTADAQHPQTNANNVSVRRMVLVR